jgi:hypothetical protein
LLKRRGKVARKGLLLKTGHEVRRPPLTVGA